MKARTGYVERRGAKFFVRAYDADGVRQRVEIPSDVAPDDRDAYAREVARALATMSKPAPVAPVKLWKEWARDWFRRREARKMTSARSDLSRWSTWCTDLHDLPVTAVSRRHIEAYVRKLDTAVEEERLGWKSAANAWGVVSRMCRDMARSKVPELRVRDDNPAEGVEPPDTGDSAARVYLYPSEMPALLSCRDVPIAWRVTYALAAYTGLRAGELAALRWSDVDGGVIRVRRALDRAEGETKTTKSGETRNVPLEPTLAPLVALVRRAPADLVVVQSLGQKGLGTLLRAHLVAAGLSRASLYTRGPGERPITFHDLRATALTWMALRGDPPQTIQQRAGHSNYATTQGYVREAETIGFVGVPFPPMPPGFLAEVREPQEETQSPKRTQKHRRRMEPTMGFEGTGNPEKHALPSGMGLFDVEERRRAEVGPSLARTRPTLAPLVGDLERWELAELGATGTRGES